MFLNLEHNTSNGGARLLGQRCLVALGFEIGISRMKGKGKTNKEPLRQANRREASRAEPLDVVVAEGYLILHHCCPGWA